MASKVKKVFLSVVMLSLTLLLSLLVVEALRKQEKPYFTMKPSQDAAGHSSYNYRITNPSRLACLIALEADGRVLTNWALFPKETVVLELPVADPSAKKPPVPTGRFEVPASLPLGVLEDLGILRKRSAVFGRSSESFLLEELEGRR